MRDSSLSACTQAVMAAEVGHLDLAADYLPEAALMDLHDLEQNTGTACTSPRWPARGSRSSPGSAGCATAPVGCCSSATAPGWERLRFAVRPRGQRVEVDIVPGKVTYTLHGDEAIEITHCSRDDREDVKLKPGKATTRKWWPVKPLTDAPLQPPGREPRRAGAAELILLSGGASAGPLVAEAGVLAVRRGECAQHVNGRVPHRFLGRLVAQHQQLLSAADHASLRVAFGAQPLDGKQPAAVVGRVAVGLVAAHPPGSWASSSSTRARRKRTSSVVLDMATVVKANSGCCETGRPAARPGVIRTHAGGSAIATPRSFRSRWISGRSVGYDASHQKGWS